MGIPSKSLAVATRSPLNFPALRVPGQSIDESMDDVIYDGAFAPAMLAVMIALMAGLDWARYLLNIKPSPWLFTVAAVGAMVYAAIRIRTTHRHLRQLKLGREGERAVAQYLDQFIACEDTFAFHDVPNEGANIDHIVVSPRGVFTIETKTLSKPVRGDARIRIDGDAITANGYRIDRNPIVQAKGQARWVSTFLADARFRTFVQPVIVFPGWFVEPFDMRSTGVWVLEPKALDRFIANERNRYAPEEVKAMASALRNYIRSKARPIT